MLGDPLNRRVDALARLCGRVITTRSTPRGPPNIQYNGRVHVYFRTSTHFLHTIANILLKTYTNKSTNKSYRPNGAKPTPRAPPPTPTWTAADATRAAEPPPNRRLWPPPPSTPSPPAPPPPSPPLPTPPSLWGARGRAGGHGGRAVAKGAARRRRGRRGRRGASPPHDLTAVWGSEAQRAARPHHPTGHRRAQRPDLHPARSPQRASRGHGQHRQRARR